MKKIGIIERYFILTTFGILLLWLGYQYQKYDILISHNRYLEAGSLFIANRFEITYNRAYKQYQASNFELAQSLYKQSLSRTKNVQYKSDIHYNLGVIFERLKDPSLAVDEYIKSLELNPKNIPAKYNLERILILKEERKQKGDDNDSKDFKQFPGNNLGKGQGESGHNLDIGDGKI